MFCEIYLQSVAHITTDPRFIYLFYFQVLFNRSSIPDFSILERMLLKRGTGSGERGAGSGERGTGNGERGTGNGEQKSNNQ